MIDWLTHPHKERWRLAYALMISLFIGYLDRVNISLALPLMAEDFGWSEGELRTYGGQLLSLFYVGYGVANLFLSPLGGRIGPRKSLIIIVILWSVFTAMGAVFSQMLLVLLASRVLLGLSEGIHLPMMNMLMKSWFPLHERGRANSIWISGLFLAILLSPVILVPIMSALGWRSGFYLLAIAGLVITLPLIWKFVWDTPQLSPRVSAEENAVIAEAINAERDVENTDLTRLSGLLRNPNFLLLISIGILNNLVGLGFMSWLPSYFTTTRGLDFADLTYVAPLPYALSLLGIWLWATRGDRHDIRAALGALGYLGAGLFVYLALGADTIFESVAYFSCGVFFMSAFPACEFALLQRVVPHQSMALAGGIYNGMTMLIGGGLGPIVIGIIIGDPEAGDRAGLLSLPILCIGISALLFTAYRRLRY